MKKYQYIVAAVCILMGAVGFAGIYATNQSQKNKDEIVRNSETQQDLKQDIPFELVEQQDNDTTQTTELQDNDQIASNDSQVAEQEKPQEAPVTVPQKEELHFSLEKGISWPVEGATLLDYSMDKTIYFPTLNQYQYHPAMVIAGDVNSKVYAVAKGKITNIETNEVTGCTVTQDMGDGYTAIYGQLKELNFDVGDMIEAGQVVGYISEPTKYYALEGSNVYFQVLKDGKPMNPEDLLAE